MNSIVLHGTLKNIREPYTINNKEFSKADLYFDNKNFIELRFRTNQNIYKENDIIDIVGNLRTLSTLDENNKYHVLVYVFTHFDKPQINSENTDVTLTGTICKINRLESTQRGSNYCNLILANNISTSSTRLSSYIPCISWGSIAKEISKYSVGTKLKVQGKINCRNYIKKENLLQALELIINNYEVIEDDI